MRRVPISLAFLLAISLAPAPIAAQMPSKEMAQAVAAYAAKVTASAIFVSGRTLESVLEEEFAPTRPLDALIKPLLQFDIDTDKQQVTCRLGLGKATARNTPNLGCVLIYSDKQPSKGLLNTKVRRLPQSVPEPEVSWPFNESVAREPDTGINYKQLTTAIDKAFVEANAKKPVNTRAIVVVHKGQLVAERYAPGFHKKMPLPGWSMSKTLTNALIGRRVQEGKMNIEVVARPEANNPTGNPKAMSLPTVRHLMNMTSGTKWNEDYTDPNSHALRMLFGSADHAAVYTALPQDNNAGMKFKYSSGSTNLLCKLLRNTFDDDQVYWQYPTDLFHALNMNTAVLETDPSGTFVGSSYCYASARDWARLGLLFLNDGKWGDKRLLPPGWVEQSTKAAWASRGRYGLQIWLNADPEGHDRGERKWPDLPSDIYSMDGHEGQYCVMSPGAELLIVRLGCTKSGGFGLHQLLLDVHEAVRR